MLDKYNNYHTVKSPSSAEWGVEGMTDNFDFTDNPHDGQISKV